MIDSPNTKLSLKVSNPNKVYFTLYEGAKLDASVISPKQLIELHSGIHEEPTLDERIEGQVLKSVFGKCTQDITGKCTLDQAIRLIRALHHRQDVKLALC